MKQHITMALAGNPNAGKTTLFNELTGARQHVGNYPGITVDYKIGRFSYEGQEIVITDLPGTYSLTAYSVEEIVSRDFLTTNRPDVVINIVDASNLERNLYLTTQFLEMGVPLIIALNMIDVAKDRGIEVRYEKLAELLGVQIVPIIARSGEGTKELIKQALEVAHSEKIWCPKDISYGDDLDEVLMELVSIITDSSFLITTYPPHYTAIKYLEHDDQILAMGQKADPLVTQKLEQMVASISDHLLKTMDVYPESMIADHRYGFIKSIVRQGVLSHKFDIDRLYASDKIDKVLTNRLIGPIVMLLILFGLYQFTFSWSELPVSLMGSFFGWLGGVVDATLPDGPAKSMLISGVIDGVGGVLGFVPLIMFMFFGIAILEDSGYLARVAFMMDRIFRIFGLHGSSVMPFIVSGGIAGGCAVPGVMATRTLRSPKERMATLLTVPFMNCGAKVPVLVLLIGAFFTDHQALYMFLFTMLAWLVALVVAKFLRTTVLKGEATPFVMELPPYRFPTLRGLLIHTWERTWQYIKKAGTVILGISIILWALMTYPGLPDSQSESFEAKRTVTRQSYPQPIRTELLTHNEEAGKLSPEAQQLREALTIIDQQESGAGLRYSIAGKIGTFLEPVSSLAGFDWRTNIALLGGFAAKEVIISTLGTAYSMGEVKVDVSDSLGERLVRDPHWNSVVAVAVLIFIMFYAPCFVTVVCIAKEAGSWKWAFFSMAFNTTFAFFAAVAVFQIGSMLG
ncbi:MAG: ferrous iron transport protein B [Proteobacteria bacterium]|nr:ferrous iron transport protein B [Pseudomonadota bacterium]MBU1057082.1 ferrous iron transport protein B [Pseudomonadota bacterium]